MLTASKSRSLPHPTDAQWDAFIEHIFTVHSWYKALPLFGARFAVFLSPHAGVGYPREYPKLPHGNTVDGYRNAFGYLDYIYELHSRFGPTWNNPDSPHSAILVNDLQVVPQLDDELMNASQFIVFPYVSTVIYWSIHSDNVDRIRNGTPHPRGSAVLAAFDSKELATKEWQSLPASDCKLVLSLKEPKPDELQLLPDRVLHFLRVEEAARNAYRELHEFEVERVRSCLAQIRQWMLSD